VAEDEGEKEKGDGDSNETEKGEEKNDDSKVEEKKKESKTTNLRKKISFKKSFSFLRKKAAKEAKKEEEEKKDDDKKDEEKKEDKKEEEKKEDDPDTPATNVVAIITEITAEADKLCKYDPERCASWKTEKELKKKKLAEEEKAEKKLKEIKGTEMDPDLPKGPGGAIPKTLEQIAAEKEEAEEAKAEEAKLLKKGKLDKKTCDKCHAEELKKERAKPKRVSERYDEDFVHPSFVPYSAPNNIPNPTVTPVEKAIFNETINSVGDHLMNTTLKGYHNETHHWNGTAYVNTEAYHLNLSNVTR